MDKLFITSKYLTDNTHLDGSTGLNNYNFHILNTQITIIMQMLGEELYDKILEDFENDNLTGLYLTMFDKYIKPVLKYSSVASYIKTPYTVGKGGVFKSTGQNTENISQEEKEIFENQYNGLSQNYLGRFKEWICNNEENIPEYKVEQDGVDADDQTVTVDIRFI